MTEAQMIDRLDDVEARWAKTVEVAARALYGNPVDYRSETAARNLKARARARRGLPPLKTISREMLDAAEAHLIALVDSRPELAAMKAELDWAYRVRQALQAQAEERAFVSAPERAARMRDLEARLLARLGGDQTVRRSYTRVARNGRTVVYVNFASAQHVRLEFPDGNGGYDVLRVATPADEAAALARAAA